MPTWYASNSTATSYTSTSACWHSWIDSASNTSAITTSTTIWWTSNQAGTSPTWLDDSSTGNIYITRPIIRRTYAPTYHAPLQEAAQRREINNHSDKARRRAERLLLSHLTGEQRATFKKNKWFIVEGGQSKRRYRIRDRGTLVANIDVLDGDAVLHRLCGHCRAGDLPLADHLLAQKMMLELAEDEFLKIANRHAA